MSGRYSQARAYGFSLTNQSVTFANSLKPYWFSLVVGCLLLLFTNLLMAYLPMLINAGVLLIEKNQAYRINVLMVDVSLQLMPLLGLIIVLAISGAVVRTLSRRVLFNVGRTIERDVRAKLFFHLSTMDDAFLQRHSVGDLLNHLSSDMTNIRMVSGFAALNVMNIVFVFLFTVPLLFKIDVVLALLALLPFPLIIIATRGVARRMFHATMEYQAQLSTVISHVQENLLGAHVVRLFHQQNNENERFAKTNQATFEAGIKLARTRVLMQPIMRLMVGLAIGIVLYVGGMAVTDARISIGDFVEINARILQLAWPAMSVGFVMSVMSRGQASLTRVNSLLKDMPFMVDGPNTLTQVHRLRVDGLSINGKEGDRIWFEVARGEMLGIVGPSGSYKSTLLRALSRRSVVPDHTIFIDQHDCNDLSLSSIYAHMAIVPEEGFLFHKSVRENICLAHPHASEQEIRQVLAVTRLDRDVATFANGLSTIVGDRGITLSGGQRQRVALARALLAKRPILILDDALSSVDAETEKHIVSHLRSYVGDALVIIATHRLSAIKHANLILVLDQGRVVATGSHGTLLETNQLYQQLWGLEQLQGLTT